MNKTCSLDYCSNSFYAKGLCNPHYLQAWRGQDLKPIAPVPVRLCSFEPCGRKHYSLGYCCTHYQQFKAGKELKPSNWGQGYTNKDGYRIISRRHHANAHKSGSIFEHVWVMSEYLGRPLLRTDFIREEVHHKNGVRHDNRLENLELWAISQPSGQRVSDLVDWAKEILNIYDMESKNAI